MNAGFDHRRVAAQVRKEITQIVRDRTSLVLAMFLPVLLMSILGNAISLSVRDVPIVVQNLDGGPLSRTLIEAYRASLTLEVVPWPVTRPPVRALEQNAARGAVIIPEHFSRDLLRGHAADIEVLVDATDANTANILRAKLTGITQAFASDLSLPSAASATEAMSAAGPSGSAASAADSGADATVRVETTSLPRPPSRGWVRADVRLWYNPGRQDASFVGPGALVVALALLPPLIAALATARERERKTILQVYVTGVSAFEYLMGKVLAFSAIAAVDWGLCLIALRVVFGLQLRGDPSAFLVGSAVFLLTTISFGVMIGARVPEQASALQAMQLGGFVLSYLLSGFIFPLSNIPGPLRILSNVTPARYYLVIVRDGFLRGGGWPALWSHILALTVLFCLFFGLAWRRMRHMQMEA